MRGTLQASLNQQLKMSPQLQQSIKLLKLSSLELQQEIQHQLEINPLLEISPVEDADLPETFQEDESEMDFDWSQVYDNSSIRTFNQSDYPYETLHCTTLNLREHLLWQLNLTPISEKDKLIAEALIDATNDDGFLTVTIEELANDFKDGIPALEVEDIEVVRHRIQRFDPIGCCSMNLVDTLLVQLGQLPKNTPHLELTKALIQSNIRLLDAHQAPRLRKQLLIDEQTFSEILKLIKHLNPKPGSIIQSGANEYLIPDLWMARIHQTWRVLLNPAALPKLNINNEYAALIDAHSTQNRLSDVRFVKHHLEEARSFLQNIKNRQETLLKVAHYIIQYQLAFFESGEQALKPLILNDVARALSLHPSTISRVTTQKYIHTPRGLLELRYFFSNPVTKKGYSYSSKSIRAKIRKLISDENAKKPLSDAKIASLLSKQGIPIARRTISKYRGLMGIVSSNER